MLLLLLYLLHILLGHIIVSLLISAHCLPVLRFIRSCLGRLVVLTRLTWQELQELLRLLLLLVLLKLLKLLLAIFVYQLLEHLVVLTERLVGAYVVGMES